MLLYCLLTVAIWSPDNVPKVLKSVPIVIHAGDSSAASSLQQAEVDERVRIFLDMEDPDVVIDLREARSSSLN